MAQVLFRKDLSTENEFKICSEFFSTVEYRSDIKSNSLILGRYSVLPFYNELEYDIKNKNSNLINSHEQHNYIANFNYYEDVKKYTFPTIFDQTKLPDDWSFIVKGTTNSRKFSWNSLMYAETKRDAIEIACQLKADSLISQQEIIFRKYVPLETFEIGINNMPITNEWRFFYLGEKIIDYGFYWSILDNFSNLSFEKNMLTFANKIAKIVSKKVNFFVLDIAKTVSGKYILVEINDAQMSGLSTINPLSFYEKLFNLLNVEKK